MFKLMGKKINAILCSKIFAEQKVPLSCWLKKGSNSCVNTSELSLHVQLYKVLVCMHTCRENIRKGGTDISDTT